MAAMTMPLQRPGNFGKLILLLLLAATTVAAGLYITQHAALHHASADAVINCDSRNLGAVMLNTLTGRRVKLCEIQPGQWGRLVIDSDGQTCVTAFCSSRATRNTFDGAFKNLWRQGYRPEWVRADLQDIVSGLIKLLIGVP